MELQHHLLRPVLKFESAGFNFRCVFILYWCISHVSKILLHRVCVSVREGTLLVQELWGSAPPCNLYTTSSVRAPLVLLSEPLAPFFSFFSFFLAILHPSLSGIVLSVFASCFSPSWRMHPWRIIRPISAQQRPKKLHNRSFFFKKKKKTETWIGNCRF